MEDNNGDPSEGLLQSAPFEERKVGEPDFNNPPLRRMRTSIVRRQRMQDIQ